MRVSATLLFGMSTIIAVWIAPDKGAALVGASLLLAGLAVAWFLAWAGLLRRTRVTMLGLLGLAATTAAAALALFAAVAAAPVDDPARAAINPNVLAAALAILLALGVAGAGWLWVIFEQTRRRWVLAALTGWAGLWLVAAVSLIASGSRGAWIGLVAAALFGAGWALRPSLARRFRLAGALIDGAMLVIAVAGVAIWLVLLTQPLAFAGAAGGRIALWRDGLALIGDAPFTGSGLRNTMMVLSTYVYILHVGYISHVHNLFLELAAQQGLIALSAWLFLVLTAIAALVRARRRAVVPVLMQAAVLGSLVAMLVHGIFDAGLYAGRLAALIFLPIGAAWMAGGRVRSYNLETRSWRLLAAVAPLAVVALLFAWPGSRATWQANLGAVAQTQAELFLYTWPEWPIQDVLRRSPVVDLAPAIARYQTALAIDPGHAVANRRLGQIALSRGDHAQARLHLEAAFARQPEHRATRLLLGEVYALDGEAERAAQLWRSIDTSMGQLDGRRWWVDETGTAEDVAAFDAARQEMERG